MMRFTFLFLFMAATLYTSCATEDDSVPVEDLPKVAISNVTLFEGNDNSNFSFKVNTSEEYSKDITVDFSTEEVTAGAGTDFVATSGTLTIAAGQREAIILVEIIADEIKELDERFKVVLSNAVNATIYAAEGVGTIRNDDTYVDIPEDGYITPDNYVGYSLVWGDEFEGTALNLDDWTYEVNGDGGGNNELQYYTDRTENSFLSDGNLVIEANEETYLGRNYTSARIVTQNKQLFQFGRVDIRAILPEGQGIWPALWMLGTNISSIGWPACGEIDIMELVGHEPSTTHGTIHSGPQGQGYSNYIGDHYTLSSGKFSDEYHVFTIIWEPNSIKWYVDDNEFYSITNADVSGVYPFNDEFFFIFNIAVGGNWPGAPNATTVFPQRMIVDYVRVFQEN